MAGVYSLAANALGFQLVWFSAVAGAGNGLPWAGPACAVVFAAAMLAWGGQREQDLRLLVVALPLGIALDSGFAATGWLDYAAAWPIPGLAPAWIAALWLGFALTLNHSLALLRRRSLYAALFGLLGAPLAYWSAHHWFDAVDFGLPMAQALALLGLGWALVLPAIFGLERRLAAPSGVAA